MFKVPYSSNMENGYGLVQEVLSTGSGNEEAGVEKVVMQEGVEEGDASQLNLVDSSNNVKVSGNGISLYVEVFCPPDSNCLAENLWKGNDALLHDNGNEGSISEVRDYSIDENAVGGNDVEGKLIDNQGYKFNVSDFAWAKTKTQSWWPGLICEPSDASKDAAKTERRDCLLVRYFGSGSLFWCWPSQLKPFHEYFEQMSRQSNSKSFLCAVKKAVGEIGRRAKMELTCPCFLDEGRNTAVSKEGGKMSVEKACKVGEVPVILFEPADLLARIRYFAKDVSVPGMIEFTVIQNCLSAFYRSTGHHQLAIHQLKPTTDAKSDAQDGLPSEVISSNLASKSRNRASNKDPKDGNDEAACSMVTSEMKMTSHIMSSKSTENTVYSVEHGDGEINRKSEKGYESRERRKSKYLLFPYVDISRGHISSTNLEENEIKDYMAVPHVGTDKKSIDGQSMGSTPMIKFSAKKLQKMWSKKPIIGHDISDMLSKLRFTARDCLYPDESINFDLVERFVSRFRRLVFRDFTHEIANEDSVRPEFVNEMQLSQTLPDVEVQTGKIMGKRAVNREHRRTKIVAGAPDVNKTAEIPAGIDPNIKSKQKGRKKGEKTTPFGSNTKPTGGISENITSNGTVIIDFQKMGPSASESQSVLMKRKKKAGKTPGFPQIKVMAGLPDLNGRSTSIQLEGCNVAGAVTPHEGKSEPKRKKEATSSKKSMTNDIAGLPDVNGGIGKIGAMLKVVEVMELYSLQNTPELNREGMRKADSLLLNSELTANSPDVIKNADPSIDVKGTQMGMFSPCGKPELKKRKRKQKAPDCQTNVISASAIPDLNGNASEPRLQENQLPENCIPPEGKPQRKRRRKKADAGLVDINLSYSEAQMTGEALGTALFLKFFPEVPMPSKEDLASTFCTFGPLKESETQVLNDSGIAQVVFMSSSDARNAFRSLEKSSPFGPTPLVNYQLHIILASSVASEPDGSLHMHKAWPVDKVKVPPKPKISKNPSSLNSHNGEGREAPDLKFVRQNLEMMTSMLENAGDNLSPEMRAKLENDIKSLLKKVSAMVGSSSSCKFDM